VLVSLIIVFREAMEAGLIVGIVLAATEGVVLRGRWIAGGVAVGTLGACLVAAFTAALSNAFEGVGQELFTAAILGFAVLMLGWHIVWMSRHAREMAADLKQAGHAVRMGHKTLLALAVVVAVAVLREGAELVLFLFGAAASSGSDAAGMAGGGAAGLALAAGLSFAVYRGLTAIPMRSLFSVTNRLIGVLAAGMAGQAASVLHGIDVLPGWGEQLWNTSFLIEDGSLLGRSLHALAGYSARPSGIQLAAWLGTLVLLSVLSRAVARPRTRTRTAAA